MISVMIGGVMHQAHQKRRGTHRHRNLRFHSEQHRNRHHHRKRPQGLLAALEFEPLTSLARCWSQPSPTGLGDSKPRAGFIFPYPDDEDEDENKDDDDDDDDDDEEKDDKDMKKHYVGFAYGPDTIDADNDEDVTEVYNNIIVDNDGVDKSCVDTILRTGLSLWFPTIKIG